LLIHQKFLIKHWFPVADVEFPYQMRTVSVMVKYLFLLSLLAASVQATNYYISRQATIATTEQIPPKHGKPLQDK
jgi:hypothetical protein